MSYEILDYIDSKGDKVVAFELTSEEHTGLIYSYGVVKFPEDNEPVLQFEYTLHEGTITNQEKFRTTIGDILVSVIEESMVNKDTIFTGGI